jgi:hypothetical protein
MNVSFVITRFVPIALRIGGVKTREVRRRCVYLSAKNVIGSII